MNVDLLQESDLKAYDELIARSDEGTIFHTSWWQNIIKAQYGDSVSTEIYGYRENETLVAAIPITSVHKFGLDLIFSGKLTSYSGPVFLPKPETKYVNTSTRKKFFNGEFAKIFKDKGICVFYPFGPEHVDLQPYVWEGFAIGVQYAYVMDLEDLSRVWENIESKRRAKIRNAYKQDLEIKTGNIKEFIYLNKETMKRQKHALFPSKFWENIYRESKDRGFGEVFTVYDEGRPTSSLLLVWDNKRSYYLAAGTSDNSKYATSFLDWEIMRFTKKNLGLNQCDFLGSSIPSIETYIRKFGGMLKPRLYIYSKSLKRQFIKSMYYKIQNIYCIENIL